MESETTEPARILLPYLQRADELQKQEPVVAYYCRVYSMERGLKIPVKERTKTTNALLASLMNRLETDKKSVKVGPEDNLYVEGFASNIFAKADKQDRAGRADLSTAKTFYAASIFFEILNQFGELQPDIEQRQKYAVWKAAEIRKALKEGRRPEPGPPGSEKDLLDPLSSPGSTYDLGLSEGFPPANQPLGGPSCQSTAKHPGRNENFSASDTGADLPSQQKDKIPDRSESSSASYPDSGLSSHHADNVNPYGSTQGHISPSSYSGPNHPSSNLPQLPPVSRPDISTYSQPYSTDQNPISHNYQSSDHQSPSYSYSNFQTYPSFHDSTLPSAPTHHPSYHHIPDAAYSHQAAPASNYSSAVQYNSADRSSNHVVPSALPAATYAYDVNYQPPAEKIAEAHKAARFAVGALAFDDVPVAVDFLRRSLELLTNSSAESH